MSRTIELTEEQYQALERAASERGQTPDALLATLIEDLEAQDGALPAYETDAWFTHLGASEEQIAEAKRIARERGDANP